MPRCTCVLKILKSLAKGFTNCLGFGIITSLSLANAAGKYNQYAYGMRGWRNRQTRSFKGRVSNIVRVQVPSLAPEKETIPNRIVSFSMIFFLKYMVPSVASGSYIFSKKVILLTQWYSLTRMILQTKFAMKDEIYSKYHIFHIITALAINNSVQAQLF